MIAIKKAILFIGVFAFLVALGCFGTLAVSAYNWVSNFVMLDGNSELDVSDMIVLRKYLLNVVDIDKSLADVNGDETVDIRDLVSMKKYFCNTTVTFKDGDKVYINKVNNGNPITVIPDWTKDGYDLSWEKNGINFDFSTSVTESIVLQAVYKARTDTIYTLCIYPEKPGGNYPSTPTDISFTGTSGQPVSISTETLAAYIPRGFTLNSGKSNLTTTIAGDGSSEVAVYLNRKTYTVTFMDYDGSTVLYREKVRYSGNSIYQGRPQRNDEGDTHYFFDKWVTSVGGNAEADLTYIGNDATVYASYVIENLDGVYASFDNSDDIAQNMSNWTGATLSSSDKQYEGTNSLKISQTSNVGGRMGVVLNETKLRNLLGGKDVESVTLNFYYNASGLLTEPNYLNVGLETGTATKISRDNAWCYYSVTFENTPENLIISASNDINSKFVSQVVRGDLYISRIYYKVNYSTPESGTYMEWNSGTANATVGWGATKILDTSKQYNGKSSLCVTANAGNTAGVYVSPVYLNYLLSKDNIDSITVSFRYDASELTGRNARYIGYSVGVGGAGVEIDKSAGWHVYSHTYTDMLSATKSIIGVGDTADLGWANSITTGNIYISEITYTFNYNFSGVYASFTNDYDILSNMTHWNAESEMSSDEKLYEGEKSLQITRYTNDGGRMGVCLNTEKLSWLLSVEGAQSVTVGFYYNASQVLGEPNYIGLGQNPAKISKEDAWCYYSATFDCIPENFILSVSNKADNSFVSNIVKGNLYIGKVYYTVNFGIPKTGTYTEWDSGTVNAAASWAGTGSLSSERQYNDKDMLCITSAGNNNVGVYLSPVYLNYLLGQDFVDSVTLSFTYDASSFSGINSNYIGYGSSEGSGKLMDKTEGFHNWSHTYTNTLDPATSVLGVGNDANLGWANATSYGSIYISDVCYTINYKNSGVYASFASDDEVNANTSSWLGTRSSSSVKQYNGKNSLSITNTVVGGRFGCVLNKENLTKLLALDGANSVTISFNYNASAVTGAPNYISLGLIDTKAMPIVKTDSWNTYSATFGSVPTNFVISVSNLANSGYSGYGVTGTLYINDITYTVNYSTGVYASFATSEEVNANTSNWLGTRSSSSVKQYNGKNSLSINNTAAGGRFGCILNKEKLTQFLALNGVKSVTISFNYNASAVTGAPNYISLGLIDTKAMPIVKTDSWNTYSATFDSVPTNFIISVSNLSNSGYSGSGVTGTLYVSDITYTVNY